MNKIAAAILCIALTGTSMLADGLLKPTYIQVTQDCNCYIFINDDFIHPATTSVQRGQILEYLGADSRHPNYYALRLGVSTYSVAAQFLSSIPPDNSDYAQAAQMYARAVTDQQKQIASRKQDQQNADAIDAAKNQNVNVHIDNQQ